MLRGLVALLVVPSAVWAGDWRAISGAETAPHQVAGPNSRVTIVAFADP